MGIFDIFKNKKINEKDEVMVRSGMCISLNIGNGRVSLGHDIMEIASPKIKHFCRDYYSQSLESWIAEFFGNLNRNLMAGIQEFEMKYGHAPNGKDLVNVAINELYELDSQIYAQTQRGSIQYPLYVLIWKVVLETFTDTKDGDRMADLFYDATRIYIKAKSEKNYIPVKFSL